MGLAAQPPPLEGPELSLVWSYYYNVDGLALTFYFASTSTRLLTIRLLTTHPLWLHPLGGSGRLASWLGHREHSSR